MNNFGLDFHSNISERISVDVLPDGKIVEAKSNREIALVNLGIEDVNQRSTLYQNLVKAGGRLIDIPKFARALQAKHRTSLSAHIQIEPEIQTSSFILCYRRWICAKEEFSELVSLKEGQFIQLNVWRKNKSIPRVINYSIDDGKQFYLDFLNPWSADSFLKLIKRSNEKCAIEAMGFEEDVLGEQLFESYFEVSLEV